MFLHWGGILVLCEKYQVVLRLLASSPIATQSIPRNQYIAFCLLLQGAMSFCAMCEATSQGSCGKAVLPQQGAQARQHASEVILHMPEVLQQMG